MSSRTLDTEKLLEMIWSFRGSTRLCLRPGRLLQSKALRYERWQTLIYSHIFTGQSDFIMCVFVVCFARLLRTSPSTLVFQFWTWSTPSSRTVWTLTWLKRNVCRMKTNWTMQSNDTSKYHFISYVFIYNTSNKYKYIKYYTYKNVYEKNQTDL